MRAVACTVVDGRTIAVTGSSDRTVRVWDLAARQCVDVWPFWDRVPSVSATDHGWLVVAAGWDVAVFAAAPSRDGRR